MKKYMPYIIFGVPALIGVLFILKSIRSKKPQVDTPPPPIDDVPVDNTNDGGSKTEKLPFKKGMKGETIKKIQQKLGGLTADGDFGSKTEAKVKEFQRSKSLTADGIVGNATWKALFGADYPNEGSGKTYSDGHITNAKVIANYKKTDYKKYLDMNEWYIYYRALAVYNNRKEFMYEGKLYSTESGTLAKNSLF
jgi:hypothetical protein